MASEEIQSSHYIGKVLPDGHLEIPQTVFEQMGLRYGDELEVALRKAESVELDDLEAQVDEETQRNLHVYLAGQILLKLQRVEQNCGEPVAAMYVDSLFSTMRTMRDLFPTEPFVEVLMALYDAMAADNNWCNLQAHQFREAVSILKKILRRKNITANAVEQAILALEDIGFDTTPFGGDIDEEE